MARFKVVFLLILLALCTSSCVTTREGSKIVVNKAAAVQDYVQLGMRYLKDGNRDGAVGSFSKALEIDSRSAEAYQGMAMVHQLNGETELAEKNFRRALYSRTDFSRAGIEFSYGRFLFENRRIKEAMHYFQSASDDLQYRGRANAMLMVGQCALRLQNVGQARVAFERALNVNPRLSPAALELADMAYANREYPKAKEYFDQYLKYARHTPRSLWLGIRIERAFGNKDKEASYALSLRNLHPYSQEYLDYKRFMEEQGKATGTQK